MPRAARSSIHPVGKGGAKQVANRSDLGSPGTHATVENGEGGPLTYTLLRRGRAMMMSHVVRLEDGEDVRLGWDDDYDPADPQGPSSLFTFLPFAF